MKIQECKCGRHVYYLPCPACRRHGELVQIATWKAKVDRLKAQIANLKTINRTLRGLPPKAAAC